MIQPRIHVRSIFQFAIIVGVMLVALVALPTLMSPVQTRAWTPNKIAGQIDATGWDFARDGRLSLAGTWLFTDGGDHGTYAKSGHPAVPVAVPGAWPVLDRAGWFYRQNGFAQYRVHLKLPATPGNERIAINTGYWMSAYRIFANGRLLLESGKLGHNADEETANSYSRIVLLPEGAREVDLLVELSNHMNRFGGVSSAPELGFESELQSHTRLFEAMTAFLVGTMFFGALYHLTLFSLDRTVTPNLWFGVFAALQAVRSLAIAPLAAETVYVVDQYWIWRVNYASTMLLLPAVYQFFHSSFPNQVRGDVARWLWWSFGFMAALTMTSGAVVGEIGLKALQITALGVIAYLSIALVRSFMLRVQGATAAMSGWLLCAGAVLHDILTANGLIAGGNLIPFGFLAFFLCLSGMLAARYREAFRQAQVMTTRLKSLNGELEEAVQERTTELKDKLDELKSNQSELVRAREAAVAANTAKSRFLATMSHELRTPLNSILGFSEIIRDERLGSLGDQRYGEYAAYINESGAHLLSLIGDILDLSRIESGKLDLQFESLSIEEMADAAMRRAATRERKAGECVTISLPPDLPQLSADRRALLQMLINLISNALKFTPVDGKITVSAFMRGDGGMTLQVTDTGIGMAAEDIPRALMAFTQVDDDLSRRHEGSGLGLTIVKSMMEQHGGRLTLQSAKGEGTTVSLEFPAGRVLPAQTAAEAACAG